MGKTASKAVVQPYLFFEGRCDEAIEFYRKALGAEVTMLMRYRECPEPGGTPHGSGDKVMHASLQIGRTTIMVSDGQCRGKSRFDGFSLTLTVQSESEANRRFAALADGGEVQMPMAKTFFSPRFGMVTDRFGVLWMILVQPPATARR